jgi:hypothetical protein
VAIGLRVGCEHQPVAGVVFSEVAAQDEAWLFQVAHRNRKRRILRSRAWQRDELSRFDAVAHASATARA